MRSDDNEAVSHYCVNKVITIGDLNTIRNEKPFNNRFNKPFINLCLSIKFYTMCISTSCLITMVTMVQSFLSMVIAET